MGIPSSGEIKMGGTGTNSIAQVKAGTDTGTPTAVTNVSLKGLSVDGVTDFNDGTNRDIAVAGSTPNQTAPFAMSEFHGYVQASYDGWPDVTLGGPFPGTHWGSENHFGTNFIQVGCNYGQYHDKTNDRLVHRASSFDSSAASTFTYGYQDYVGLDNATFQAKAVYNTTLNPGFTNAATNGASENPASYSPASGTWTNVSSSSYSPTWQWTIEIFSGNSGTATLTSSSSGVAFYTRANLSGTYYPNSSGYNNDNSSGQFNPYASIYLQLTRGTSAAPGGGSPP